MRPSKMNGLKNIYGARMKHIIYNAIRTPDGTILESHSTHDYKTYQDLNGKEYMIDGGKSYVRSSVNGDEEYLTVYGDEPHEKIREVFTWGTYGKYSDQPLKFIALKTIKDNHLPAILETQIHLDPHIRKIFEDEINYRMTEKKVTKDS